MGGCGCARARQGVRTHRHVSTRTRQGVRAGVQKTLPWIKPSSLGYAMVSMVRGL